MKTKNMMTPKFNQSIGQSPWRLPRLLMVLTLPFFALSEKAQAVSPAPDGGYPGGNTAEGQSALLSLTTGDHNTAVGFLSLGADVAGSYNTATGAGALFANTADENTATGFGALLSNRTGQFNTANGALALVYNETGHDNTAIGFEALFHNTTGYENTATGGEALFSNTTGHRNTAIGRSALFHNDTGNFNTAAGKEALRQNTVGVYNTAIGFGALYNNTTGNYNIAIGYQAGYNQTTGIGNVYIGAGMQGVAGESDTCYIANIFGQTITSGTLVYINTLDKLGTMPSSKRFKEDIQPMNNASEALLALKPVTFRYKKEIDPAGVSQFGLVAEDVEKVNPDLVVRDQEGKPHSVRYDQVNAMLLNEFLKEHYRIEKIKKHYGSAIAQQQKTFDSQFAARQEQIETLAMGLEKLSAQLATGSPPKGGLELNKRMPQMTLNHQ